MKTCGDIYDHRGYLAKLFGDKAFQFLITCHLGLGRTKIQPAEEYERKSVGTESTFRDMNDKTELRSKLRHIAEELSKDLVRTQFRGRTLVLKVKLHTYEVLTRQTAPPTAIHLADDLYKYSLPILAKLEKEIPGMTLRLMGLRLTHLISMKKEGVNFFGSSKTSAPPLPRLLRNPSTAREEWEVWPESEFEDAVRQEEQEEMDKVEALSQEHAAQVRQSSAPVSRHGYMPNSTLVESPKAAENDQSELWPCPICGRSQPADDRAFNEHIDFCLSKVTIQEVVRETPSAPPPKSDPSTVVARSKKRAAGPMSEAKKRLFFG